MTDNQYPLGCRFSCFIAAFVAISYVSSAGAAFKNSVNIEGATVSQSAEDIQLGVHIEIANPMVDFVFPLEIRSTDGSAFWNVTDCSNFAVHCTGCPDNFYQLIVTCNSGSQCTTSDHCVDGQSPDRFLIAVLGRLGYETPVGTYPDWIEIQFDVGPQVGRFLLDTCFFPPNVHLFFADHSRLVTPDFVAGEVCVNPDGWGDMTNDNTLNLADIIAIINYLFHRATPPPNDRADYNCDGRANLVDVVRLVDALMRHKPVPCCPSAAH